jgi:hypothetical protein
MPILGIRKSEPVSAKSIGRLTLEPISRPPKRFTRLKFGESGGAHAIA